MGWACGICDRLKGELLIGCEIDGDVRDQLLLMIAAGVNASLSIDAGGNNTAKN